MLCAELRRAMVKPERVPLSGMVEADETMILFRTENDSIVVPGGRSRVGKTLLVASAVEIDGGKPRRARLEVIDPTAAHVALGWIHRLFSNLERWIWASTTGCERVTSTITSMSSCSA
jgi:hypothetical protein